MIDRRTQVQQVRLDHGLCRRCGGVRDRSGTECRRCRDRINARDRQRYAPGRESVRWTASLVAASHALAMRGWW